MIVVPAVKIILSGFQVHLSNPVSGEYIYLDELKSNELKSVDSVKISDNGTFQF